MKTINGNNYNTMTDQGSSEQKDKVMHNTHETSFYTQYTRSSECQLYLACGKYSVEEYTALL